LSTSTVRNVNRTPAEGPRLTLCTPHPPYPAGLTFVGGQAALRSCSAAGALAAARAS